MPARKPKSDEKPQIEDFIEAARDLGSDESREAFERVFKKVAQKKSSDSKPNIPTPSTSSPDES